VVAVEGAGCNWLAYLNGFVAQRGERPFLLVTPLTLSSTNKLDPAKYPYDAETLARADEKGLATRIPFDESGLLQALADVRRDFGGEERFYVTGFSGGGILAWWMALTHPEMLAAAAPACPNFAGVERVSEAPERARLPIRVFQGEKDPYLEMLESQWELARETCERYGFRAPSRERLPGIAHESCARPVLDFFESVREEPDSAPDR